MNTCKNCNNKFRGQYCNNCGQKASTGKLTFRSVIDNLAYGITNCDTGILFTYKELFTRPGRMFADFIAGKRVIYFKPFPMLIVTAGLYSLLTELIIPGSSTENILKINSEIAEIANPNFLEKLLINLDKWSKTSMSFISIISIPIFALACKWAFYSKKRPNYNFTEYTFICAYLACQRLMLGLILRIPMLVFSNDTELHGKWLIGFSTVCFGFTVWDFKQLFELRKRAAIGRTILMFLYWLFIAIVILAVCIYLIVIIHNLINPDDPYILE